MQFLFHKLRHFTDNLNTYIYFLILAFIQLTLSINISSYGTTFVDLKYMLHTSIDKISLVILFQSCGSLLGCCFGFIYKWLNRQLTICVMLVVFSFVVVFIPFSEDLWQLYLCSFITGISYGVFFNSNNVWLLEMFGDKVGPILQLFGFINGVGTILGPVLYQPYVTGEMQIHPEDEYSALSIDEHLVIFDNNQTTLSSNQTLYLLLNANESFIGYTGVDEGLRRFKLKIPFLICGIIVIIGAAILLVLFLFRKYKINSIEIEKGEGSHGKISSDTCVGKLLVILCMLLFLFHRPAEDSYMQFMATYLQYIPLGLTASKSAEIISYMGLVYTLSQGISIFIAIKMRPQYMLAYSYVILIVGIIIMFFGKNSLTLVWVGILILSFGMGAMFPLIFSFMNQQIEVTDRIGTFLNFAAKVPGLFVPSIIGTWIETTPDVLLCVVLFGLVVCILLIVLILIIVRKYKNF